MIDITKAQGNQTQRSDGTLSDWTVTLGDEELFSLPAKLTPEEFFEVRDAMHTMMLRAAEEMSELESQLCTVKIDKIVEVGDAKLNALKEENERLANAFEQHILNQEEI